MWRLVSSRVAMATARAARARLTEQTNVADGLRGAILASFSGSVPRRYVSAGRALAAKKGERAREPKKSKAAAAPRLSAAELEDVFPYSKMCQDMADITKHLANQYSTQLELKTSTASLDRIQVTTSAGRMPLIQLGRIHQKSPTLLVIDMTASPQHIKDVMKALADSALQLNPQQDKNSIFIETGRVTAERRQELAKAAKKLFNDHVHQLNKVKTKYEKLLKSGAAKDNVDLQTVCLGDVQATMVRYRTDMEQLCATKCDQLLSNVA